MVSQNVSQCFPIFSNSSCSVFSNRHSAHCQLLLSHVPSSPFEYLNTWSHKMFLSASQYSPIVDTVHITEYTVHSELADCFYYLVFQVHHLNTASGLPTTATRLLQKSSSQISLHSQSSDCTSVLPLYNSLMQPYLSKNAEKRSSAHMVSYLGVEQNFASWQK